MFFTVNIGNTNTAAGCIEADRMLVGRRRTVSLSREKPFSRFLARLMRGLQGDHEPLEGAILACVVPEMRAVGVRVLHALTGRSPLVLDRRLDTGIDLSRYQGLLGADRIAACVGAQEIVGAPFVVVDMGTATTVNAVDRERRFLGGMICPGLQMGLEALAERTAQLPETGLDRRTGLFGTDTQSCLVAGAVRGSAAMVDGIGAQALAELGPGANLVLTGGNARRVASYLSLPVRREPDLVMKGLAAVYRRQMGRAAVDPAGTFSQE